MTDFDRIVRQTMTDVVDNTTPDSDLADRLIANAAEGRVVVTPLQRTKRGARWTGPLLAAAAVIVIAGGVAVTKATLGAHDGAHPATHAPSPLPHTTLPGPGPKSTPTTAEPVQKDFSAVNVSFQSATDGYALGVGCHDSGSKDCAELLHTTDGRTWNKVPLPSGLVLPSDSASCGTNGTILGPCVDNVLFADAQHGYVYSLHEFYTTTDGGKHWKREAHSPHTGAAELVLFGDHVLRMRPIADCSAGCRGDLQVAAIGSTSWKTVTPTESGLYNSRIAVHGSTAYFLSGLTAETPGGGLYRSTDGTNWSLMSKPCGTDEYDLAAGFDGSLAVSCATDSKVHIAPAGSDRFGAVQHLPGNSPEIVALLTDQQLVTIDGHTVYRTTDGGTQFARTAQIAVNYTPVAVSADFIYAPAANGRTLFVSTDGGVTWQQRAF